MASSISMNSEGLAARIENLLGSSSSGSAENLASRAPPPVPDHEIIGRIGGGSYGEVWLARSVTGALRAVKVVWRSHFSSERPYEREFRGIVRFEPISRSHPGVVNVLHVGRDDAAGCFFYLMELADAGNDECRMTNAEPQDQSAAGSHSSFVIRHSELYSPRTLASELKARTRLAVTDAVSLGVQLAGALGHLHRHGLVHRDVKPSNVIFVNGQPKLADIGLVTGVNEERSFVGTDGFIPPEGPGTERADLFALGRLLYEAATGKNRCDFPGLPDDLDRWAKSERAGLIELNEVLSRACAPEAKNRHSSAADLAGDLNLILAGRSVRRAYRLERRLRYATLVCVIALVLVVAALFSNWLQRRQRGLSEARARRETALRNETQKSLARAEAAERESQQQLYSALFEQARATVRSSELGHRVKALEVIRRAAAISNSPALRGVALVALGLPDLRLEGELPYDRKYTLRQPDPSFERIALCRDRGPIEIRSTSDLQLLATLPASTNLPVYVSDWSPDGRFLAVKRDYPPSGTSSDQEIWDVSSVRLSARGERVSKEGQARRLLLLRNVDYDVMAFHPHLSRLLVADYKEVTLWDLEQGTEVNRILINGRSHYAQFAPDGERFAVAYNYRPSAASIVSIHRAADGQLLSSNVFAAVVPRFDWHPSGDWIAAPENAGGVHRMDAQTGQTRLLGRHKAQATHVDFSPDGAYLMSGGWDREINCWDSRSLQRAFTVSLNGYVGQFCAEGQAYALATETGVKLFAFERANGRRELTEDLGPRLGQATFSADSRCLAVVGTDRLGVWDLQSHSPAELATNATDIRLSFAANGELFADRYGACYRFGVSPGINASSPLKMSPLELAIPKHFFSLCVISNSVVLTCHSGTAVVGQDELGIEPRHWQPTIEGKNGVSPDGRWLGVFRAQTPHLFVYRFPELEPVATLTNAFNIAAFQFSPAGDELAVCCRENVEFWSTTNWQGVRTITNFNRQLYSPDGRTMWLSQDWRASELHDARTLELLLALPRGAYPLAVSPDGHRLAVSVDGRRLQLWDLPELRRQLADLGLDWEEKK